jgi:hypothetical protein
MHWRGNVQPRSAGRMLLASRMHYTASQEEFAYADHYQMRSSGHATAGMSPVDAVRTHCPGGVRWVQSRWHRRYRQAKHVEDL